MKKNLNIIKYIGIIWGTIIGFYYLIFAFIPQYEVRDHEGYLGGAIVLAGYIGLILVTNLIKETLLIDEKKREYIHILSIADTLSTMLCIRTLLFYHARVYVISLIVFLIIPASFVVLRILTKKLGKEVKIDYIYILCLSGILSLLSTVVRGLYIFRWQIILTIASLCLFVAYKYLLSKKNNEKDNLSIYFPYDFDSWANEIKSDFISKFKIVIVIVLSLVVLYLFLGPLEIYAGNMISFSFGYKTFMPIFLGIGAAVLVIIPTVISMFTRKTYKLICIFLTAFSLLSYIQYMFMNTKLMEEDGARLRLNTMGNYPTINLIIWCIAGIALLGGLYIAKDAWRTIVVGISAFISAIQIVAVVSLVITCVNSPAPRFYQLTGDKMFSVAKDENIIVLMPDTFARQYLTELLEDDPQYMSIFKDFTYYDNMNCEYFPTFPSVIHTLTGYEKPDGTSPGYSKERVEWQTAAWNSKRCNDFVDLVKANRYKYYVNIPSACELLGAYDDVKDKVDNTEYAESNVDRASLVKMLFSMSIYRCVPYVIKPPFEYFSWDFAELERYEGKKAAYRNEDFYKEVCEGISVDDTVDKKFHVINWHGFHDEYTNDEYCNHVDNAEQNGVTMLQNEKAVMLCIKTYLEKLKEIDRYDDSTIIIMGDHGFLKYLDGCVFIKLPNERHDEVVIDDEPRIYGDFQATILEMMEVDEYSEFGHSWLEK